MKIFYNVADVDSDLHLWQYTRNIWIFICYHKTLKLCLILCHSLWRLLLKVDTSSPQPSSQLVTFSFLSTIVKWG